MEWQPIETAPKDGTKILVFTAMGEIEMSEWYVSKNYRYDHIEGDVYKKVLDEEVGLWNSNYPTHWMPLPKPPSAESAKA